MRTTSLTAREAIDSASTDEIELVLMVFESPELDRPIRISTDPTELISESPLQYGTRSTWMGADPEAEPYLTILATPEVPGDQEGVAASAAIVLENVSRRIGETLRSLKTQPVVHLGLFLKSNPDVPEIEYLNMVLGDARGTDSEVRIEVSRRRIEDETVPYRRFTPNRFPGLHR